MNMRRRDERGKQEERKRGREGEEERERKRGREGERKRGREKERKRGTQGLKIIGKKPHAFVFCTLVLLNKY